MLKLSQHDTSPLLPEDFREVVCFIQSWIVLTVVDQVGRVVD